MKINNQKMKVPTNTHMLKISHIHNTNAISPPTPYCNCMHKLDKIQQQISNINTRIVMIFKCIEIPKDYDQAKKINNQNCINGKDKDKDQNNLKIQQQKQVSEQSFLLEGIDGSINQSYRPFSFNEKEKIEENHCVGNYISKINQKMKDIQEKVEQIGKLKTNVSLMTKIIEQMEKKFENSDNFIKSFKQSTIISEKVSGSSEMFKSREQIESNGQRPTIKQKRHLTKSISIQPKSLSKVERMISQQSQEKHEVCSSKKQDKK